jgi:uncharacterized protein YceH (UPF0502 family)
MASLALGFDHSTAPAVTAINRNAGIRKGNLHHLIVGISAKDLRASQHAFLRGTQGQRAKTADHPIEALHLRVGDVKERRLKRLKLRGI